MVRTGWKTMAAVAMLGLGGVATPVSAALFDGHRLEIGWTGGNAFDPYVVNGTGMARGVYIAPMTQAGGFSTSNYASSTDMRTWVTDTNIRITNDYFGSMLGPTWFSYIDLDDTLPDFRTLSFTIDAANTTLPGGYDLATRLQVSENAIALEFGAIPQNAVVSIDVAVPEPTALAAATALPALLCRRRRRA